MKITKGEFIFKPSGHFPWSKTHAQVPFPLRIKPGVLRIFFATRDEKSRSSVTFIEVDEFEPTKILYIHDQPCLSPGNPGSFDDSGTMPSWIIEEKGKLLLYYTGWNKSESASYRLSIGLAESSDQGLTFQRAYPGPILDRGHYDPIWVAMPSVTKDKDVWKMWFISCQEIRQINNHPEPFYCAKYAESNDGRFWQKKEQVCIDFDENTDAIARPCVWKKNDHYYMLHSNRLATAYRTDPSAAYRIELSTSVDGLSWIKSNEFSPPKADSGWRKMMNAYTAVIATKDNKYLVFFNGDGFGSSGFGYFTLEL